MTKLVLGPLLRHVGERTATVWVETDQPGAVTVLTRPETGIPTTTPTFTVHGHHYALVEIDGLAPGTDTVYEVHLDGTPVWPDPGSVFPPSQIRTIDPAGRFQMAFGSCRIATAVDSDYGADALAAYARLLAAGGPWPSVLLLLGDQVYADHTTKEIRAFIEARRDIDAPPYEVVDFEEYTELYRLAWAEDPAVRWLLSTVPTFMIFDDHDIRDDWNTSYAWRQEMLTQSWWRKRIISGLGSYWVYQHLGNLTMAERAADPVYRAVREAGRPGGQGDGGKILDEFAEQADRRPSGARWSYAHTFGRSRLVVVDSRCSRVLERDRRAMLDDDEHTWLDAQCRGDVDHLLIASSLPYLLPASIHHAESWNEALCAGLWGRRVARLSERLRQGADLEHWAAFQKSFRSVAAGVLATARGERGAAPASITFLSGDVHYSYLARVSGLPIAQVVCSPLHNPLADRLRWANRLACVRGTSLPLRWLARAARVPRPPMRWRLSDGPWFANAISTVEMDGRKATVRWQAPSVAADLTELAQADLTDWP